jgi:hypothetical protein
MCVMEQVAWVGMFMGAVWVAEVDSCGTICQADCTPACEQHVGGN